MVQQSGPHTEKSQPPTHTHTHVSVEIDQRPKVQRVNTTELLEENTGTTIFATLG